MPNTRLANILSNQNTILTNLVTGYSNNAFVGENLFPRVNVDSIYNRIPEFAKDHMRIYKTDRALRADARILEPGDFGSNDIVLEEQALGYPIDWQEKVSEPAWMKLLQYGAKVVTDSLLLQREVNIATMVQTTGNYGTNNKSALSGASCWSATTATPVANLITGIQAVRTSCGQKPNTAVFGWTAWVDFIKHADTIAALFGPYGTGVPTEQLVAQVFGFTGGVYVGAATYMDSLTADTMTDVWSDNCILAYVPQTKAAQRNAFDLSFGYSLQHTMTPPSVKDFDKDNSGLVHIVLGQLLAKIALLYPGCGYLISNTRA